MPNGVLIHYTTQTGGDGGIRTHEALLPARFRDEYLNPLGHISSYRGEDLNLHLQSTTHILGAWAATLNARFSRCAYLLHHTRLEDAVGFEPTELFSSHAFQACPLNHSGKRPGDSDGKSNPLYHLDRVTCNHHTPEPGSGGRIRTERSPGYEPSEMPLLYSAWWPIRESNPALMLEGHPSFR